MCSSTATLREDQKNSSVVRPCPTISDASSKALNTSRELIVFNIHRNDVPQYSKVKYCRIVCNISPHNKKIYQVRITLGGENFTFYGPVSTAISDLTNFKLQFNSDLASPGSN